LKTREQIESQSQGIRISALSNIQASSLPKALPHTVAFHKDAFKMLQLYSV